MEFCFIADNFVADTPLGGAEVCNDIVISMLREAGHSVDTYKCSDVTSELIDSFEGTFIISNRMTLPYKLQQQFIGKDYVIFEQDFGVLFLRDPSLYDNYIAPISHRINLDFYRGARKVICQSDPHLKHFYNNSELENLVSAKANPFTESSLQFLESLLDTPKTKSYSVLSHPFHQKNTKGAEDYCKSNNYKYSIIERQEHDSFLKDLVQYKYLVFQPKVLETFSRVCAEAACLNLDLITNNNVSFTQSEYSHLKGQELIDYFRRNNLEIIKLFENNS